MSFSKQVLLYMRLDQIQSEMTVPCRTSSYPDG